MRHSTGKKIILATALLSAMGLAQADDAAGSSDAIQFGVQAGSIAGMTQACGQDISVFVTRVNEALNKLAISPTDRVQASAAFQRTLQQTQTMETNDHSIPCIQVLQDYNSLPILRSDYQQTVIAQLHPGMPANAPQQAAPSTAAPAAPTTVPTPTTAAPTASVPAIPQPQPSAAMPSASAQQPAASATAPAMDMNNANPQQPANTVNNNMPANNSSAAMQPLPQGGSVPSVPNTSTTPPPATNYNQGALPGSQQQQMAPAPSNSAGAAGPAASMPSPNLDQNQQQATPPPVTNGSPDQ
jgi:hypothetical protein